MIGDTASITLLTGLPGSGKTLRVVKFCKEAVERGEVVFVSNLNGLKVPHVPFDDPRNWRDIPPGSVLVVDEAQMFFRARRGGDPPEYLTAMETIRHQGVRLVLTTQQPDYLDTHLRGLVGLHEHLVRENGKAASKIYRHNEVMDNVRSERARSRYDSEVWEYPKELFALYESAQVHTVKYRMSAKVKRGLIMGGFAVAMLGLVGFKFAGWFSGADATHGEQAPGALPTVGREARGPVERPERGPEQLTALEKHEPEAMAEYLANLTPRVSSLLWSAPIFDDRSAVAEPRAFCMASGEGLDASGEYRPESVTCVTEQGTVHAMDAKLARALARNGEPYNPFRKPEERQASRQDKGRADGPAPATAVMQGAQVTGYGDLGHRDITEAPVTGW